MEILEESNIAKKFVEFLNGPLDELAPKIAVRMALEGLDHRTNGLYFVKVLRNYFGIINKGGLKEAKEYYDLYCNENKAIEMERVPLAQLDALMKERSVAVNGGNTQRIEQINELIKDLLDL